MPHRHQYNQAIRFSGTSLNEDWREDFLNYLGLFDSEIKAEIAPATDDQITTLNLVAPLPLPQVYRDYLAMAGMKRGSLLPKFQAKIGLEASLELYRETAPEELPEGVFLIGYGFDSIYPEIGLLVSENTDRPKVVAADAEEVIYTLAESLPHLLFQQAFLGHEIMSYPVRRVYGMVRGRHLLAQVGEHCTALGFKPEEFSDAQNFCARCEGAAIHIHQISGGAGWLYLSGLDAKSCLVLDDQLSRSLDLIFLRNEPA